MCFQPNPAPTPELRGRIRPALALRMARLLPCLRIVAFHHDWRAIDDARRAADAMGLSDRVRFHHISAAPQAAFLRPIPSRN